MKSYIILIPLIVLVAFFSAEQLAIAQPKISNCTIFPKDVAYQTEVTISFDYENVEGGLKEGKVLLNQKQKIQLPDMETFYTRVSNWQRFLSDLSAFTSESGKFEKKFVNPDKWEGPPIDLIYELKVVDKSGGESNTCTTNEIRPK